VIKCCGRASCINAVFKRRQNFSSSTSYSVPKTGRIVTKSKTVPVYNKEDQATTISTVLSSTNENPRDEIAETSGDGIVTNPDVSTSSKQTDSPSVDDASQPQSEKTSGVTFTSRGEITTLMSVTTTVPLESTSASTSTTLSKNFKSSESSPKEASPSSKSSETSTPPPYPSQSQQIYSNISAGSSSTSSVVASSTATTTSSAVTSTQHLTSQTAQGETCSRVSAIHSARG
jgi:hypothetical protein